MACGPCTPDVFDHVCWRYLPAVLRHLPGIPNVKGVGSATTGEEVLAERNLKDHVIIITGASGTLGAEMTRRLYTRGAHVVLACRSISQAMALKAELEREIRGKVVSKAITLPAGSTTHPSHNGKITPMECDLSSMASVRDFAKNFLDTGLPLHVLINNAAVMACSFSHSVDGQEMQFAVNHLGHHLLCNLLLEHMAKSAEMRPALAGGEGRIVNITCSLHYFAYREYAQSRQTISFRKLDSDYGYDRWLALGQSKAANILHARELGRRCKEQGLRVTVNAANPGLFGSQTVRKAGGWVSGLAKFIESHWNGQPFLKRVEQAAACPLYCALSPDMQGVSGEYVSDCEVTRSGRVAQDMGMAERLWEESERIVASVGRAQQVVDPLRNLDYGHRPMALTAPCEQAVQEPS